MKRRLRDAVRVSTLVLLVSSLGVRPGAQPVAAASDEAGAAASGKKPAAKIVATRWGDTPRGATRVVFELDQRVEHVIVESPTGTGYEVHLLGTQTDTAPDDLAVENSRVTKISFRPGATGLIAVITTRSEALRPKTFALGTPPRVVVDLYPAPDKADARSTSASPRATAAASPAMAQSPGASEPVAASKSYRTAAVVGSPTPAASLAEEGATVASLGTAGGAPGTPDTGQGVTPPVPVPDDFTDLLAWIHRLRSQLTALEATREPVDLARLRRGLAHLLAERGFYREAETALVAALATGAVNTAHTFGDSLYLAELRLETGRVAEAAEVARTLSAERQVPAHRLRLAKILSASGFPQLAITHVESMMQVLNAAQRAEAQLLKARCLWDLGRSGEALQLAQALMGDEAASAEIAVAARILAADCLFALGRMAESERLYREVVDEDLGPNEAAWTRLQLGHLARRAGRLTEALAHYRTSYEVSPDTHYSAQAQWFMRVADRLKQAELKQAEWERG